MRNIPPWPPLDPDPRYYNPYNEDRVYYRELPTGFKRWIPAIILILLAAVAALSIFEVTHPAGRDSEPVGQPVNITVTVPEGTVWSVCEDWRGVDAGLHIRLGLVVEADADDGAKPTADAYNRTAARFCKPWFESGAEVHITRLFKSRSLADSTGYAMFPARASGEINGKPVSGLIIVGIEDLQTAKKPVSH